MAKDKTLKYRVVLHNLSANNVNVTDAVRSELGDVEVLTWAVERKIDYTARVDPDLEEEFPQRDTIVTLEYRLKENIL